MTSQLPRELHSCPVAIIHRDHWTGYVRRSACERFDEGNNASIAVLKRSFEGILQPLIRWLARPNAIDNDQKFLVTRIGTRQAIVQVECSSTPDSANEPVGPQASDHLG